MPQTDRQKDWHDRVNRSKLFAFSRELTVAGSVVRIMRIRVIGDSVRRELWVCEQNYPIGGEVS